MRSVAPHVEASIRRARGLPGRPPRGAAAVVQAAPDEESAVRFERPADAKDSEQALTDQERAELLAALRQHTGRKLEVRDRQLRLGQTLANRGNFSPFFDRLFKRAAWHHQPIRVFRAAGSKGSSGRFGLNFAQTRRWNYPALDVGILFAHECLHALGVDEHEPELVGRQGAAPELKLGVTDLVNIIRLELGLPLRTRYEPIAMVDFGQGRAVHLPYEAGAEFMPLAGQSWHHLGSSPQSLLRMMIHVYEGTYNPAEVEAIYRQIMLDVASNDVGAILRGPGRLVPRARYGDVVDLIAEDLKRHHNPEKLKKKEVRTRLLSERPSERIQAIRESDVLGEAAIKPLLLNLEHASWEVRAATFDALWNLAEHHRKFRAEFIAALGRETISEVKFKALPAAGALLSLDPDPALVTQVLKYLQDGNPEVRKAAIAALREIQDPQTRKRVRSRLELYVKTETDVFLRDEARYLLEDWQPASNEKPAGGH